MRFKKSKTKEDPAPAAEAAPEAGAAVDA